MLAADLVRARVPTIVFGQSRNSVEVMLRYLRDAVATKSSRTDAGAGVDPEQIMAYRGGYLPEQRRDIERRLRDGRDPLRRGHQRARAGDRHRRARCRGLRRLPGVHRGHLAAPRSRGAAGRAEHRRARRVERAARPVPGARAAVPARRPPSRRRASTPTTSRSSLQHLKCAAFELPFKRGEAFGIARPGRDGRGARVSRAPPRPARVGRHVPLGGGRLPGQRRVAPQHRLGQRRHHRRRARQVDRASSTGAPRTRCCTSRPSTSTTASAGRSSGSTTRTTRRSCGSVEPDYWTDAMTYVQVSVLEESATGGVLAERVDQRLGRGGGRREGRRLQEDQVLHARERRLRRRAPARDADAHDGVLADGAGGRLRARLGGARGGHRRRCAASAWRSRRWRRSRSCAIRAISGRRWATRRSGDADEERAAPRVPRKVRGGPQPGYSPTLFLYEHVPGGTGLAERIWEQRDVLVARALRLVETCPCRARLPRLRRTGRVIAQDHGHRAAARGGAVRPDGRPSAGGGGGFAVRRRAAARARSRPGARFSRIVGDREAEELSHSAVTQTGPTSR